jgi:hypothetical protein
VSHVRAEDAAAELHHAGACTMIPTEQRCLHRTASPRPRLAPASPRSCSTALIGQFTSLPPAAGMLPCAVDEPTVTSLGHPPPLSILRAVFLQGPFVPPLLPAPRRRTVATAWNTSASRAVWQRHGPGVPGCRAREHPDPKGTAIAFRSTPRIPASPPHRAADPECRCHAHGGATPRPWVTRCPRVRVHPCH